MFESESLSFDEAYSKRNPQSIVSLTCDIGGSDTLDGDADEDVIIGGASNDTIQAGTENDVVAGDCVLIEYNDTDFMLQRMESINTDIGGDDVIWLGEGDDYAIGGASDDEIHGENGLDVIVSIVCGVLIGCRKLGLSLFVLMIYVDDLC